MQTESHGNRPLTAFEHTQDSLSCLPVTPSQSVLQSMSELETVELTQPNTEQSSSDRAKFPPNY